MCSLSTSPASGVLVAVWTPDVSTSGFVHLHVSEHVHIAVIRRVIRDVEIGRFSEGFVHSQLSVLFTLRASGVLVVMWQMVVSKTGVVHLHVCPCFQTAHIRLVGRDVDSWRFSKRLFSITCLPSFTLRVSGMLVAMWSLCPLAHLSAFHIATIRRVIREVDYICCCAGDLFTCICGSFSRWRLPGVFSAMWKTDVSKKGFVHLHIWFHVPRRNCQAL